MAKQNVLLEIPDTQPHSFSTFQERINESVDITDSRLEGLAGIGLTVKDDIPPVPMFTTPGNKRNEESIQKFNVPTANSEMPSETVVISCEIDEGRMQDLKLKRPDVMIWPNSDITLFVDCHPFQPAVTIAQIQQALSVGPIFDKGFRGQNIIVGIVDEGVHGGTYPIIGGYARPGASRLPGGAPISSHGSMCAADILVAAPSAQLYDYPFLGVQNSGGVLTMMQAILNQRRINGTPHIVNNSYGYAEVPDQRFYPNHEVHDPNHPVNRKIREVVVSGASLFFAAGNCGVNCPSGNCHSSSIGPGRSIHAANSMSEVITVAAVNSAKTRIGYSSQGPGMFYSTKPDISSYSHFFGNFGPGRPGGGTSQNFDNGTSAATPVAAGVAALLMSALGVVNPSTLKAALIQSTVAKPAGGFDYDIGHGVINALNAFNALSPSEVV